MDVRIRDSEADRLLSLRSYAVLDTVLDSAATEAFAALTRLAAGICHTPVSLISVIDEDRQCCLSSYGLQLTELPRTSSVCSDTVAAQSLLVIPDLRANARYAGLETVLGPPRFRAYAGVPIIGRDGLALGAMCVLDTSPRIFSAQELTALGDLARQVVTGLELRRSDHRNGLTSPQLVPEGCDPTELRRAMDNEEFIPHFQPLVDMGTGAVTGFEALIRWQHPTRGLLSPDAFLAGLEAGSLAVWTGDAVLEGACALQVELRKRGVVLRDGIAVNVSSRQLSQPGMAHRILERLTRHGLPGGALIVEITETGEIDDLRVARRELLALRAAGVGTVADDFGVGWSNLVRMLRLPLCGLKIDRQLVTEMVDDPVREHMVASAISLSVTMGLDVIAEGVETEAARDLLLRLGCRRGQGWLFSAAVPASEALAMVLPPHSYR